MRWEVELADGRVETVEADTYEDRDFRTDGAGTSYRFIVKAETRVVAEFTKAHVVSIKEAADQ